MKQDYKKKQELYKKLGAEKFQKVVFAVENLKYKLLKKFWPNFIDFYDKQCDKKRDKELKKEKYPKKRREIIERYRYEKMAIRKEMNREQNRNYHMDMNKPTEILHYLEWNKSVHVKGMIKNAVLIPALGVATALGFGIAIPFLLAEIFSLFINFQCINIQNYNICRVKEREQTFQKLAERRLRSNIAQYGEAAKVIDKTLGETEDIPSFKQILENAKTPEELEQLKKLIQITLAANQSVADQKQGRK